MPGDYLNYKMERKVVITGLGLVTPNGIGIKNFWENISQGVSVSQTLEEAQRRGYGNIQGCEVKDFSLQNHLFEDVRKGKFNKKGFAKLKQTDKSIQMGVLATKLALENSGLEYDLEENNIGIYMGNAEESIMSQEKVSEEVIQMIMRKTFRGFEELKGLKNFFKIRNKFKKVKGLLQSDKLENFIDHVSDYCGNLHNFTPPNAVNFKSYALPGKISSFLRLHGPSMAINTACSSGLDSIGQAYLAIKYGIMNRAVAGGAEAPITLQAISTLDNLGIISKNKPKPFCLDKDGFAISEGAGVVFLEEKESAKKRKAHIYAEVKGYGQSIDGNTQSCAINTEAKYLKKAIQTAMQTAKLNNNQIQYINVHGTATQNCESIETKAVKGIFKDQAHKLNLSATKAMTGHSIGAIGGVEAIILALAIKNNLIPATINLDNPDPECDLNNTPISAVRKKVNNALSMSMGFGGYNSALILGDYE